MSPFISFKDCLEIADFLREFNGYDTYPSFRVKFSRSAHQTILSDEDSSIYEAYREQDYKGIAAIVIIANIYSSKNDDRLYETLEDIRTLSGYGDTTKESLDQVEARCREVIKQIGLEERFIAELL